MKPTASRPAGLVRVGFAWTALLFANSVFGGLPQAYWVFSAYLVLTLGFQILIHRDYAAGELRSLWMGAVDIAFLTYVVYLLGPASNVLPFVYLLIPVLNAASSSTRSRVAMRLAVLGAIAYSSVLLLTGFGLLPYAPAHEGMESTPPALAHLFSSGILVVLSVLATTSLVLRQMTALDRMNQRLSELSQLDDLTGLHNRRTLSAMIARQLERTRRGASLAVMMIDLDGFKRVNDQLGHDAGDALLVSVAAALSSVTRSIDLAARYGGDEFVIVLPDVDLPGAVSAAERVVEVVASVSRAQWANTPVTASVGVTLAEPRDDVASLLRRADARAYDAKRAGGNRVASVQITSPTSSGVILQASVTETRKLG